MSPLTEAHGETGTDPAGTPSTLDRREFLRLTSRAGLGLALAGGAGTVLAACGGSSTGSADGVSPATTGPVPATTAPVRGPTSSPSALPDGPVVGDVLDHALTSDDWEGAFGFVTMRMHAAVVDDGDAWFIRTDASDATYAKDQRLVFVPRLRALAAPDLAAPAYLFDDEGQPMILSTQPGRDDYTPAIHLHRVSWTTGARALGSADAVEEAADAGDLEITETGIVVNAPVVAWPGGRLPSDDQLADYLGPGQLIGEPDTTAGEVTFKLHECYPGSRYIVTDTSAPPMAEGMHIGAAPRLQPASDADATGRVNVFAGGIEGPGPMGFQPSVFDSRAGDPVWSPYWDHMTYAWGDDVQPRVLETEEAIHAARDAGEVTEFVGTPDTDGQGFVVNCPVPVVAPNTFRA